MIAAMGESAEDKSYRGVTKTWETGVSEENKRDTKLVQEMREANEDKASGTV